MVFRTKKQKRDNGYRKLIKTKKNKKTSLSSIFKKKRSKKIDGGRKSYFNKILTDHCQIPLCYRKNNEIHLVIFFPLTDPKQLEPDTDYIWVIKETSPNEILVAKLHEELVFPCGSPSPMLRRLNHNCLANNENILCGGLVKKNKENILFDNYSGHYQPDIECLKEILAPLLDRLGLDAEYIEG